MDDRLSRGDISRLERVAQLLWRVGDPTNNWHEADGLTEEVSRLLWTMGEFGPAQDGLDRTLLRGNIQQNVGG